MTMPTDLSAFREIPKGQAYTESITAEEADAHLAVKVRFFLGGRKYGAIFLTEDPRELARTVANLSGTIVQWQDYSMVHNLSRDPDATLDDVNLKPLSDYVWEYALPSKPWPAGD